MTDYSSLQSSIESAVESYETYKSQSLRVKLDSASAGAPAPSVTKAHAKRASLAMPSLPRLGSNDGRTKTSGHKLGGTDSYTGRTTLEPPASSDGRPSSPARGSFSTNKEFQEFITVAENYENSNYLLDLDFLLGIVDFMRSEHPYTSNSLQKGIKTRHNAKKKLWSQYTAEMQGLARAYSSGKPIPLPAASSPLSPILAPSTRSAIKERIRAIRDVNARLETAERTCADSVLSALSHLHSQAIKDVHVRYSLPDPINDKVTSVDRHNERVRVFNQLIRFVSDDLRRIEMTMKASGQVQAAEKRKDKKGSGVVEAVESLCVDDYPPYGSK